MPYAAVGDEAPEDAGQGTAGPVDHPVLAARSVPASVAMLVIGVEASFSKKADRRTVFTGAEGAQLFTAVAERVATGEGVTATVETVGLLPDGEEAARFCFTWSFRRRAG